MRLLDLTDFTEDAIWTPRLVVVDNPRSGDIIAHTPYAILSHRWQADEVLYSDVINGVAHERAGFGKLIGAARIARMAGSNYLWADTCCIDKTSSAELSEAINSMYYWYMRASQCIVYLYDVHHSDLDSSPSPADIAQSEWFRRGWTLQELLAPHHIDFYSATWTKLGDRMTLAKAISDRTRIPESVVRKPSLAKSASIAARMSWASTRKTEREEDQAYCLLGLFGVNMALLYGERSRAFIRLQEEIMKTSDDYSLFAWKKPPLRRVVPQETHSLLADSPLDFADSGEFVAYEDWRDRTPYYMTNMGLCIELHIRPSTTPTCGQAILPCGATAGSALMIEFRWLGRSRCARINCSSLPSVSLGGTLTKVYFDHRSPDSVGSRLRSIRHIVLHQPWARQDHHPQSSYRSKYRGGLIHIHPAFDSDAMDMAYAPAKIAIPSMSPGVEAAIWYELYIDLLPYEETCCVLLGALSDGELGFAVSNHPSLGTAAPNIDEESMYSDDTDFARSRKIPKALIRTLKSQRLHHMQHEFVLHVAAGYALRFTMASSLNTSRSNHHAWLSIGGGHARAATSLEFDVLVSVERPI